MNSLDEGKVVGINSFIREGTEGLNFAIAINEVKDFIQFNNNFTEFLGKKGSGVRYEGVKKAEGNVEEIMSRLDLHPLTGMFDAGAVLLTKVKSYDKNYNLTELSFNGGVLRVTGTNLPIGRTVRAHIKARDVSIMLSHPKNTSILNIFKGRVTEIGDHQGSQVDVKIDIVSS